MSEVSRFAIHTKKMQVRQPCPNACLVDAFQTIMQGSRQYDAGTHENGWVAPWYDLQYKHVDTAYA